MMFKGLVKVIKDNKPFFSRSGLKYKEMYYVQEEPSPRGSQEVYHFTNVVNNNKVDNEPKKVNRGHARLLFERGFIKVISTDI